MLLGLTDSQIIGVVSCTRHHGTFVECTLVRFRSLDILQLVRLYVCVAPSPLAVAYAQLLSMGNIAQLVSLYQVRVRANAQLQTDARQAPLINLPNDSTIDWDWSKIGR